MVLTVCAHRSSVSLHSGIKRSLLKDLNVLERVMRKIIFRVDGLVDINHLERKPFEMVHVSSNELNVL